MFGLRKRVEKLEMNMAQDKCDHRFWEGFRLYSDKHTVTINATCSKCRKNFVRTVGLVGEMEAAFKLFLSQLP